MDQYDDEIDNFVDDTDQHDDNNDILNMIKAGEHEDAEHQARPAPDIWTWGLHPLGLGYVPHVRKRQRLYLTKSEGREFCESVL